MNKGLGYNTINGNRRYKEGQQARLRAEVFNRLQDVPINYSCAYRRIEQANQHRKGWDSVTAVDIDVAVKKVKAGQANLLPKTAQALGVN
jgi:hypothetical protein